jgi:hypothetical protein
MHDPTLKALVLRLINDATRLVRGELRLVQAETEQKITNIQLSAVAVASGILTALAASLILLQALVIGLSNVMAPALAALLVGGVVALAGWALVRSGSRYLSPDHLKPDRTIQSLRDTREIVEGRLS